MLKNYPLTLDISSRSLNDMFEVNSNDLNTINLEIKVKDGLYPFDLTGKIVRLAVKKPDETVTFQTGGIISDKEGKCKVILSRQAYLVEGKHEAELMIYEGVETVAVTTVFYYKVRKAILNDETLESTNEFPAIHKAIEAGERLKDIDIDIATEVIERVQRIQEQVNQLVIQGDSSVEAAQMRVDVNGVTHPTAKARVDSDYNAVTAHVADYKAHLLYNTTTGTANTYVITPSLPIASYTAIEGVSIKIKIHADNTGASTININGKGAVAILNSKGNPLPSGTLKTGIIYTLCYNGTSFILQGEGGGLSDADKGTIVTAINSIFNS